MSFNCEILADSKSPQGDRITTMKITFPRYILAEFNTHRMFSRNSASSRAIPFKKMVKMVEENPFIPIAWQKDHKGMQGTEYFEGDDIRYCVDEWLLARDEAIIRAERLNSGSGVDGGSAYTGQPKVTKQLCNRLLEPFMWHTVIVTATEWENFFKLRCPQYDWRDKIYRSIKDIRKDVGEDIWTGMNHNYHLSDQFWRDRNTSQAEIHIQAIAELMWDAYNESVPKELKAGEWHIPFGDNINTTKLDLDLAESHFDFTNVKIKIAVARCARISYETLGDDPKIDYEADLRLFDILSKSGHWSPFEHVAKVMSKNEYERYTVSMPYFLDNPNHGSTMTREGWCRNFKGFIQYRALMDV
jgi:thymidylate synthase ThyX